MANKVHVKTGDTVVVISGKSKGKKGKDADMIVTDSNPLEDLRTLRNVRMVVARGRLVKDPKVSKYPECERELDKFID